MTPATQKLVEAAKAYAYVSVNAPTLAKMSSELIALTNAIAAVEAELATPILSDSKLIAELQGLKDTFLGVRHFERAMTCEMAMRRIRTVDISPAPVYNQPAPGTAGVAAVPQVNRGNAGAGDPSGEELNVCQLIFEALSDRNGGIAVAILRKYIQSK